MKRLNPFHAAALSALLVLCACGDGGSAEAGADLDTLFDSQGQPSASARQRPAGWAVPTRAGLYATPEQVEWQALTAEPYTVVVDVDRHASVEEAAADTLRNFRWAPEGPRAAFYVRSVDPARAAAAADALSAGGVPTVFVVTGGKSVMRRLIAALLLAIAAAGSGAQVTVIDDFEIDQASGTTLVGPSLFGRRSLSSFPGGAEIDAGVLRVDFGTATLNFGATLEPTQALDFSQVQSFFIRWQTAGTFPRLMLRASSSLDATATVIVPAHPAPGGSEVLEITAVELWTTAVTEGFTLASVVSMTLSLDGLAAGAGPVKVDDWWVSGTVTAVPEPATAWLFAAGLLALAPRLRRRTSVT